MSPKIFISYSHEDVAFVEWLVRSLRHNGVEVWWDAHELVTGDYIKDKIRDGIQASSVFIIILSESSKKSKWVGYELNSALMLNAAKNNIKIIPIKIDGSPVPVDLNNYLYVDASKNKEQALDLILSRLLLNDQPAFKFADWSNFNPKKFVDLVIDLLINENRIIRRLPQVRDSGFDLEVEEINSFGQNEMILVEIKLYRNTIGIGLIRALHGALLLSRASKVLLVTNSELTSGAKTYLEENSEHLMFWDGPTLISKIGDSRNLIQKYFPRAKPQIEPVKIIDEDLLITQKLIQALDNCPEGLAGWKDYEDICIKIFNHLFVPPLREPRIQSRRENGIDIRDVIYPNRSPNENWKFIREDYDAKYIVVEFKNYAQDGSEIDKHAVLQVDDYLKKTIGRFGIICSRKHPNVSGLEKRKDVFIENNKLILFMHNEHLKDMLLLKYKKLDPSDVIIDLIDDFNLKF